MTQPHTHAHHSHHDRPGHGPAPEHDTGLAEILDLDAVLGAPVLDAALDAASGALDAEPTTIVDLGSGTGTGTLALARRFDRARVHSLDASPAMVERLRASAAEANLADRVQPQLVDLDGDWPSAVPAPIDLAWAALSLHHVTDPAEVLSQAFDALRPGGVLVVIEMTAATSYRPTDLGTGIAGLGDRVVSALAERGYPVTAEWTQALRQAGFVDVERREAAFAASTDTSEGTRYLALHLTRNRDVIGDDLSADELAGLDSAIAELEQGAAELAFESTRFIWTATRPAEEQR
ncbi:class I SAM-dependent methyltransferase [Agreia sp. Leaf283]|uniref:class I SAM-dependent methyltransferase n=1 Tax=Agreia sp. Leaf283 TaxID=1736321 RepID=UPI00138F1CE5|nr:class I SAM-dependent methyltransferase [Agreia sp. Leaf283]